MNPVHITISTDLMYAINVLGFDCGILGLLWALAFVIRGGINRAREVQRFFRDRPPLALVLRHILIGKWKPMRDMEPIKPAVYTPQIWDTWRSI